MKLEELIKKYREDNDISQREFARRCDLSNSLISLFEMGKNPQTGKAISPDLETYRKLANGMGMSVQQLWDALGDDATVRLGNAAEKYDLYGTDSFIHFMNATVPENLSEDDQDILEALHQDPQLRMLFDRVRKMSKKDRDKMVQISDIIKEELYGE